MKKYQLKSNPSPDAQSSEMSESAEDSPQQAPSDPSSQLTSSSDYPPRSLAEWVTFSVALVTLSIVVGLVSYLWLGKEQNEEPPDLRLSEEQVRQTGGQFYVPFTIENQGGQTAESVQVIAELRINGEVEEGEQQIDFLASEETAEGAFVFSQDPSEGELILRVASYKLP